MLPLAPFGYIPTLLFCGGRVLDDAALGDSAIFRSLPYHVQGDSLLVGRMMGRWQILMIILNLLEGMVILERMVRTDRTIAIELDLIQALHSVDYEIIWYFLSCLVARLPFVLGPASVPV